MNNTSKMHPSNEAVKMQIAKIAAEGNRPEDWKSYIDEVKLKAHAVDESKRNLILSYFYYSALKVIPKSNKSLAHAQLLVEYAWLKSGQSVADAENLLSYGRIHLRQFAIIFIASAELALKTGNNEQAKKYIKSAYFHGAEPTSLVKEAAKRLCKGFHQLLCDEDKDSSSSSGHESSEPELSGECSGSYFKASYFGHGKGQENSLSNLPGLKYNTEELQEGFDLFSKMRETNNDPHLKSKDEEPEHTSPVKNFNQQEDCSSTSPVMPKTPKTPAFSSQRFQNIFNAKRQGEKNTTEDVSRPSQDGDQTISEKVLKENSGLLNLVTPCMKKRLEGMQEPPSHKLGRMTSVSKLKSFAFQPPRRVKVDASAKLSYDDEDNEKSVNSVDAHTKEGNQKMDPKRDFQDGLYCTPASKTATATHGNSTSQSASMSLPFANSNTYSVHKTAKVDNFCSGSIKKNLYDAEVQNCERNAAPVDRKLFHDDNPVLQKAPDLKKTEPYRAQNEISSQKIDCKDYQNNMLSKSHDGKQQSDQEKAMQTSQEEADKIDNSNHQRQENLPQNFPQPVINPPRQPVQNGQKVIYVNSKPYIVTRLIGRGGSAKVFQVQDPETFEMKALKSVNLSGANTQILDSFKNEIALLKKLQACDCVIHLYDSEYDQCKKKLLVVMEFGETDLANFIAKNGSIKNQDELYPVTVCYLWGNMVKAVRAMHKEGVVHSDLKPANFILVSGNIKLIDFGIANSIQQDKTSMLKDHTVGTPSYMSPEALMSNNNPNPNEKKPLYKIGFKSDVWSLGCILYQMVYGQTPFQGCRFKLEAIVNPSHVINFPPTNDAALTDILQKCLTRDVKIRPTTEQLMMHPYLTKQKTETQVNDPISNLMSEGASIATASPRSQQAFCLKFQKAMEQMNSTKKHGN